MPAPELSNIAIAEAFDELGDLYELDGAIVHRVLAYRSAAKAVREASVSVAALAREGRATELAGDRQDAPGEDPRARRDGLDPGRRASCARSSRRASSQITRLPGLGAKRARLLHSELGIDSPEALREAAQTAAPAHGARASARSSRRACSPPSMRSPLHAEASAAPRLLLTSAVELGETLAAGLERLGGPGTRVLIAGSARRRADSVKDIDLIAVTTRPTTLAKALARLPEIESVSSAGKAGARARTHSGVAVDLRIAEPAQLGNLLQHFTGSGEHNAALREAAVRTGLHVSEYGILDDATGTHRDMRHRAGGL